MLQNTQIGIGGGLGTLMSPRGSGARFGSSYAGMGKKFGSIPSSAMPGHTMPSSANSIGTNILPETAYTNQSAGSYLQNYSSPMNALPQIDQHSGYGSPSKKGHYGSPASALNIDFNHVPLEIEVEKAPRQL